MQEFEATIETVVEKTRPNFVTFQFRVLIIGGAQFDARFAEDSERLRPGALEIEPALMEIDPDGPLFGGLSVRIFGVVLVRARGDAVVGVVSAVRKTHEAVCSNQTQSTSSAGGGNGGIRDV